MRFSSLLRFGLGVFIIACAVASPAAQANLVAIDQDTTNLYAVSSSDATLTLIGETGIADFGSLEFREADGFLYGVTAGSNAALYRIDANDASTTLVGSLGISTFEGGLAFATDGTAYGVNGGSAAPALFRLNMETGEATLIAAFTGIHDFDGLGWHGEGLIGLDRVTNALLAIDPVTAATSLIQVVDPIVGGIGGMVLNSEFGYFATAGPAARTPGSNELFTFDPKTGSHAVVGTFTVDGEPLSGRGVAGLAVIPEPGTILLFAAGGVSLLIRRRRA